jgi:hypothetical protein
MTPREREVFVTLVQFVDREHDYASGWCHPTPGEDCTDWCPACAVLRHVADDVIAEARNREMVLW